MHSPLAALLWSAGGFALSISDLIRVATHLGWLDDEIRWMARCDTILELAGPEAEDVQLESESFRYSHDMLTAEETERWLEARDLTLDDFQLHCERLAVAAAAKDSGQPEPGEDAAAASARLGLDDEAWRIHLWLSGQMHRLARQCAWLLIAAREAGEPLPGSMPDNATWRHWGTLLKQQTNALLSGSRVARSLEIHRWPLTRLSVEVTEFPDDGMAREAELCLTEGSATMEEIAESAGAAREVQDCLIDELAQELQNEVVTLPVGGVRLVERPDRRPCLIRVLARIEPSLEDPSVRARIAQSLQEDLYGSIEQDVISWEHPLLRLT